MESISGLDYIFFVYGLAFFLLAAVCYALKKEDKPGPDWKWLGLFALLHGANEWLDLLAFTFSDPAWFSRLRLVLMALSFVPLLQFAADYFGRGGVKTRLRPLMFILATAAAAAILRNAPGANAVARYCLGLTGGLAAAAALWAASNNNGRQSRAALRAAAAAMGLYALAAGAVVPEAAFSPARWLNAGAFAHLFGFPVQLLRGALAAGLACAVWFYRLAALRAAGARENKALNWAFILLLAAAVTAGKALTDSLGNTAWAGLVSQAESTELLMYRDLSGLFSRGESTARALAGSTWLAEALLRPGGATTQRANAALDRYCSSFGLAVCYLMNEKGVTTASSNRSAPDSFVGRNYAFRPYFSGAMRAERTTYLALGVTSGERGFYAAAPVFAAGRVRGVAVTKTRLDILAADLKLFPYLFLVSPEGVIFISSDKRFLLKSLWPVDSVAVKEISAAGQFGKPDFTPLLAKEPLDDDTLAFSGDKFFVSRSHFTDGWSLVDLTSTLPVRAARFTGIQASLAFCTVILLALVLLARMDAARADTERLLALKEEVRDLNGIIPICASCKQIRNDRGYWDRVETYISAHSGAKFSHGLCPACVRKLYPEYADPPDNPSSPAKG